MSKNILIIASKNTLVNSVIEHFTSKDFNIDVAYFDLEPDAKINGHAFFIDVMVSRDEVVLAEMLEGKDIILDLSFLSSAKIDKGKSAEIINNILSSSDIATRYILIHGSHESYVEGYNESISAVLGKLTKDIESLYIPFIYNEGDEAYVFFQQLSSLFITPVLKNGERVLHPIHFVDFMGVVLALFDSKPLYNSYFIKGVKRQNIRHIIGQVSRKKNGFTPLFININAKFSNLVKSLFDEKEKVLFSIFEPQEQFFGEDLADELDIRLLTIDSRIKKQTL